MTTMKAKWSIPAVAFVLAMSASIPVCHAFDGDYFSRRDTITEGAGDAIATNNATQTIDPWSPRSKNTEIKVDGKRAQIGISRYQQNQSIAPKGLTGGASSSQQSGGNGVAK